jgi:short subunit dehydrogenase-like uncharacterized protein
MRYVVGAYSCSAPTNCYTMCRNQRGINAMVDRRYDVVLYGASGFTGKQTVQYFAQHVAPGEVRWAIAGRNRQKLESVKAQVGVNADVLVADSQDQTAIDNIVSQTRVLLNTAGPFALYGNAIVDACVRLRTHYVDITGETPWVRELCDRYHERAASDGTRIIPCCGFDSVPSDLGTYLVVRYMQRELGTSSRAVKAYFQAYGGFNGGTLASGFQPLRLGSSRASQQSFSTRSSQRSLSSRNGTQSRSGVAAVRS